MKKLVPFSSQRTMRITLRNMRKSIDLSISKVFEHVPLADQNQEVSQEIFQTLAVLHKMRKHIDDFQQTNGVSK